MNVTLDGDGVVIALTGDTPAPVSVDLGWINSGDVWSVPLAQRKTMALAALGSRRATAETQFTFNGAPIYLDQLTQARIQGAVAGMQIQQAAGGAPAVHWQVAPGQFVDLDYDAIIALGSAAFVHVQGCFDNAMALSIQIAAAETLADLEAIDLDSGWPA